MVFGLFNSSPPVGGRNFISRLMIATSIVYLPTQ